MFGMRLCELLFFSVVVLRGAGNWCSPHRRAGLWFHCPLFLLLSDTKWSKAPMSLMARAPLLCVEYSSWTWTHFQDKTLHQLLRVFIGFCRFYRAKGFLDAGGAEQYLSWDAVMGSGEGNAGQQIRAELLTVCQKTSACFQPPCPLLVTLHEHCEKCGLFHRW